MKKIKKHFKSLVAAGTAIVGTVSTASAASLVDVTGLTPDTTAVGTLGAVIVGGLLGIWGFRKIVKSVNRS